MVGTLSGNCMGKGKRGPVVMCGLCRVRKGRE